MPTKSFKIGELYIVLPLSLEKLNNFTVVQDLNHKFIKIKLYPVLLYLGEEYFDDTKYFIFWYENKKIIFTEYYQKYIVLFSNAKHLITQ